MGSIMGSQNIMGSDCGSNISGFGHPLKSLNRSSYTKKIILYSGTENSFSVIYFPNTAWSSA
jgi:hypothetical protein